MFGQRAVEGGDPRPPADETISPRVKREGLDHSLLTSSIHPPDHHKLNMSSPSVRDLNSLPPKNKLNLISIFGRKQGKPNSQLQVTRCLSVMCCTFCKGDKTAVKPNKSLYSTQLMFISNQRIRGVDKPNFDSFKCSETHTQCTKNIK